MVYRIALHNLKHPADAQDVTQDVFLKLITNCPDNKDDEALKCWLIRVTINRCNSLRRMFWHSRTESLDDCLQLEAPAYQGEMEELYELPPKDRNILYLHYYEKYTTAEIARMLRMNPNTVGSRLRRAREKLKEILTEGGQDE